jgi:hypothetical protein
MNRDVSCTDLSYSMFIDGNKNINDTRCPRKASHSFTLRHVEPKTLYNWVDDEQVAKCYDCKTNFPERTIWNGYSSGKHHCRNCGRIFCGECSNYEAILEEMKTKKFIDYIKNTYNEINKNTQRTKQRAKQRVCKSCFSKIKLHEEIHPIMSSNNCDITNNYENGIFICGGVWNYFDIKDYFKIACINKLYNRISMEYFSKFREIQYKPFINLTFDRTEKRMLLNNMSYFPGHGKWIAFFIKSIDWNNTLKVTEKRYLNLIKECLMKRKTCNCWNLMCTRNCKEHLGIEDTILLLTSGAFNHSILQGILLEPWDKADDTELMCYINVIIQELPNIVLVNNVRTSPIIEYIIKRCHNSRIVTFNVFWTLYLYNQGTKYMVFYEKLFTYYYETMCDEYKIVLTQQQNLVEYFKDIFKKPYSKETMLKCKRYFDQFKKGNIENFQLKTGIFQSPIITNCRFECLDMKFRGTRIKSSNSRPLIIPCVVRNQDGHQFKYEMMYKKDDLRQEKIIMDIIQLMDIILKREENLDLSITTYNILPINNKEGFIEMISSSKTLYQLQKDSFTIQNFINENNPDTTVREWKTRFVNSCVAHCIISYLLGIGDRHLENMMITNKGCLFHIDYGYILGSDPKFMAPEIRSTPEMIDAMNGYDSEWYEDYKTKCSRAYNCLRRHANVFMLLLSPLYKMTPTILNNKNPFTKNMIAEQVMKRFIPNENYQEAKLNFITKIEHSHTSSLKSSYYIDYFHRSKEDIYIFEDEIREYKKKKESQKRMRAKAKVKISIDEVKDHKQNKNEQNKQNNQPSSKNLSPTNFLSVSKLKSSIQNIFY